MASRSNTKNSEQETSPAEVQKLEARAKSLLKRIPDGLEGRITRQCNALLGLKLFVILHRLDDLKEYGTIRRLIEILRDKTGWLHNFIAAFCIVFNNNSFEKDTLKELCDGITVFSKSELMADFVKNHIDLYDRINTAMYAYWPAECFGIVLPRVIGCPIV